MSLALVCNSRCSLLASLKRLTARAANPMAFSTSALRAFESAIVLRAIAAVRVDVCRRLVRISLTTVRTVSTNAPRALTHPAEDAGSTQKRDRLASMADQIARQAPGCQESRVPCQHRARAPVLPKSKNQTAACR